MAKETGKLTVLAAKNAGPGKHFDGGGLYLEVLTSGSRIWRLKYRHAGKESRATFGRFPEVGLAEARERAAKARLLLRDGVAPNAAKAAKVEAEKRNAGGVFPVVAEAWLVSRKPEWADETYRKAAYVVDTYLIPKLRRVSIATLTTKQAADTLAAIPPALASKARGYLGQIVTFAIRKGLREDGKLLSLRGAIPRHTKGHIPAAIDVADVRKLVQAIAAYPIPVTRNALTMAMLTAQRPGNVVAMEWAELDLDVAEWTIPASKMKTGHAHLVPLSRQAVEVLGGMLAYTDGHQFVFPALFRQETPHLHRDALSNALRKMGFQGKHATHGFRGMFRTMARERLNVAADVLEAQLAHAKKDEIQKAYDRTSFVKERKGVMQAWADYLDGLRNYDNGDTKLRRAA
jgi:integrase